MKFDRIEFLEVFDGFKEINEQICEYEYLLKCDDLLFEIFIMQYADYVSLRLSKPSSEYPIFDVRVDSVEETQFRKVSKKYYYP